MKPAPTEKSAPPPVQPEIKDAALIFNPLWEDLEAEFGRENLRFPKELILLAAPAAAAARIAARWTAAISNSLVTRSSVSAMLAASAASAKMSVQTMRWATISTAPT